jgi:hypothetical protein
LVFGFLPGEKRFTPVFVAKAQLQCFPEPFIKLKGFSCCRTAKLWWRPIRRIMSINRTLWSTARLHSSKMGAHSNWFGATSSWRVLIGIPNLNASVSNSSINAVTLSGIDPK